MVNMSEYIENVRVALLVMEDTQIDESSMARIYSQNQNSNFGTITAYRFAGKNNKRHDQNVANNRKLKAMIHQAGFGVVNLHGMYDETGKDGKVRKVREHSFGVIGAQGDDSGDLLNHLKGWGKAFGQDSILHKSHDSNDAYLHATNDTTWIAKEPGKKFKVGKFTPNFANPDGNSSLKGKTFSYYNENKPDGAINEGVSRHDDDKLTTAQENEYSSKSNLKMGTLQLPNGGSIEITKHASARAYQRHPELTMDHFGPLFDDMHNAIRSPTNQSADKKYTRTKVKTGEVLFYSKKRHYGGVADVRFDNNDRSKNVRLRLMTLPPKNKSTPKDATTQRILVDSVADELLFQTMVTECEINDLQFILID